MQQSPKIPGEATLERTTDRVFAFLMGVAANADISKALLAQGFTPEEEDVAWRLLARLRFVSTADAVPARDERVLAARERLEVEGRSFLRRLEPAAGRFAPTLYGELLRGVSMSDHIVLSLPPVLERLQALPADGVEAVALRETLEKRNLGAETQKTLATLANMARGIGRALPAAEAPALPADRQGTLLELYRWLKDWSATAREVLPNRVDLIRLGIARKRTNEVEAEPAAPEAPTQTPPANV